MGTQLIGLHKSFPMNTNMAGFKRVNKICILVPLIKVTSALEGLKSIATELPSVEEANILYQFYKVVFMHIMQYVTVEGSM